MKKMGQAFQNLRLNFYTSTQHIYDNIDKKLKKITRESLSFKEADLLSEKSNCYL